MTNRAANSGAREGTGPDERPHLPAGTVGSGTTFACPR